MNHVYAQNFHPETLLERVRDVRFYRLPRTLFKGFTVPDWARPKEKHGWEMDVLGSARDVEEFCSGDFPNGEKKESEGDVGDGDH